MMRGVVTEEARSGRDVHGHPRFGDELPALQGAFSTAKFDAIRAEGKLTDS